MFMKTKKDRKIRTGKHFEGFSVALAKYLDVLLVKNSPPPLNILLTADLPQVPFRMVFVE